jgi:hypothetical protein
MMEHHNEKVINWKMLQEAYNNLNTHVRRAVTATVRTAINLDYHLPLSLVIGWNRGKKKTWCIYRVNLTDELHQENFTLSRT